MNVKASELKKIIEAALFAVAKPMSVEQLQKLFDEDYRPSPSEIVKAIELLQSENPKRGVELKMVGSGYRYQSKQDYSEWISRLWEEKPAKYSRAAMETLALIAYRQPVTRAEIEDVRGVGVSTSIIKTMIEREWIRVVGHRDVPGRPSLYATTKQFLDYFNMRSLEDLPTLAEIKDIDEMMLPPELQLAPSETDTSEAILSETAVDSPEERELEKVESEINEIEAQELVTDGESQQDELYVEREALVEAEAQVVNDTFFANEQSANSEPEQIDISEDEISEEGVYPLTDDISEELQAVADLEQEEVLASLEQEQQKEQQKEQETLTELENNDTEDLEQSEPSQKDTKNREKESLEEFAKAFADKFADEFSEEF